jgi:predicted nucleic-acid-binding protein
VIGLDTNVLVRYITQDDPAQALAALRVMDSLTADSPGFLSLVVMVEIVWVLEVSYGLKKLELQQVLETLLRSKELVVERAEIAWQAFRKFGGGNSDFADCLIERSCHAAECEYTVTFDRKAAVAGMKLLKH